MSTNFDGLTPESQRARKTAKWSMYGPDVLAAWVAEMDFACAPAVRAAIDAAVAREEFGYPQTDQLSGIAEACAGWQERAYGWKVDPAKIHTLPDVLTGVELGIGQFTPEGSPVILPTAAYMPFFVVPGEVNREIIEVPMLVQNDRYELDLEGIGKAYDAGARTLILCNPYNPLGRSFTIEELTALCEVVDAHGGRVVSDEIHAPLTYAGHRHIPYASINETAAAHTVTVVSASKAWNLPGLKCAQAIMSTDANEEIWSKISGMKTHGASTIGIRANIAAWNEGESWLKECLEYLDGNRHYLAELLKEHLPEVKYRIPEATYLAWLDCRDLDLPGAPADFFLEHAKVAMNDGARFGEPGIGFCRFNFATSKSMLEQIVKAMAGAVNDR